MERGQHYQKQRWSAENIARISWQGELYFFYKTFGERDSLNWYVHQILSGETTLSQLATKYSDCSSAKRGGDLGLFNRGAMQKPFEDAAFALNVGEISDIIETESGLHLIERTQ